MVNQNSATMKTETVIILTALWIAYGMWSAYQTKDQNGDRAYNDIIIVGFIVVSPLIALYRAVYGIFRMHTINNED